MPRLMQGTCIRDIPKLRRVYAFRANGAFFVLTRRDLSAGVDDSLIRRF